MLMTSIAVCVASVCVVMGAAPPEKQPGLIDGLKKDAKEKIEQSTKDAKNQAQNAVDEMNEMARQWMETSSPGEGHKALEAFVGTWSGEAEFWMDPAAPSEKSTGTMVSSWVLGGRWVRQDWAGSMMGQPFTGVGYFGYDNVKKKYIGTWMDSMSTGLLVQEGTYDEKTKSFTMIGTMQDPMGNSIKVRHVAKVESADKNTFEMYHTGPDGKENLAGRIVYTRKK